MMHFNYLKQLIKNALEDENYNEVYIEGTTFKEVIIDSDINYDKQMENTDSITLNTDNLIINGNGHSVNLNHHSDAFHVSAENVIIKNFNFLNCRGFDGGAIKNTGVLKIDNCTFTNCEASKGGAIYNTGVLIVEQSSFENNTTTYHLGNGGAICNENISLIFNSKFINNNSQNYGGAIFNGKTLMIDNCFFKRNTSNLYGGTIKNKGFFSFMDAIDVLSKGWDAIAGRSCSIKNCVFEESEGTIIRTSSDLDIENCIFRNCSRILSIHSSTINIKDCLFEKNVAPIIDNTYSTIIHSLVTIENCDFINNKPSNTPYSYFALLKIGSDRKHWTVKNCHFKNNASDYMLDASFNKINLENVSFEDNDCKLLIKYSGDSHDNGGLLNLKDVSFKENSENIIECEGNLEINNCRFQKHHKINNESVFDIYKSEEEFIKRLKDD